jgi:Uma2 family endonuclease
MNAPVNIHLAAFDRGRHRFTLDDWAAMEAAGILPRDMEFELIEGDLIDLIVIGRPKSLRVVADQTLPWPDHNGPKPDFYLFPASVSERALGPADVVWVIEIADTSLDYDRRVKGPLYAAAGIPDYWIFDVNARVILVHRDPVDGAYREVREVAASEAAAPLCAPELVVRIADLPQTD